MIEKHLIRYGSYNCRHLVVKLFHCTLVVKIRRLRHFWHFNPHIHRRPTPLSLQSLLILVLSVSLHFFLCEFELADHDFEDLQEFIENQNHWVARAETSSPVVMLILMISHEVIQLSYDKLQHRMITFKLSVHLCELSDNELNRLPPFKVTHLEGLLHMQALLAPLPNFSTEILIVTLQLVFI